jgi:hypothetical protein
MSRKPITLLTLCALCASPPALASLAIHETTPSLARPAKDGALEAALDTDKPHYEDASDYDPADDKPHYEDASDYDPADDKPHYEDASDYGTDDIDTSAGLPDAGLDCDVLVSKALIFTVTDTSDLLDADLTDDLCISSTGTCTLRAAIQQANATGADFTYIAVSRGEYDLTIPAGTADATCIDPTCMIAEEDDAATGDLDITTPMCIVGRDRADVVIRGGGDVGRAFDVHAGASSAVFPGVVMDKLRIEDSYAPAWSGVDPISYTVVIAGCEDGEDACSGGGIRNQGELTLRYVDVRGNASQGNGNGVLNTMAASLLVHGAQFEDNADELGHGGGVLNMGMLTVQYSTFNGNVTDASGGAISNMGGVVDVVNSTFDDNASPWGGSVLDNSGEGQVSFLFSTIGNSDSPNTGAAILVSSGQVILKNSIIADTFGDNCIEDGGTIAVIGDNLSTDTTCPGFTLSADPALEPLSVWFPSPTPTLSLGLGSAAIDASTDCTDFMGAAVDIDQRGAPRAPGTCDLGAHEQ